jgi:hypothetical protein
VSTTLRSVASMGSVVFVRLVAAAVVILVCAIPAYAATPMQEMAFMKGTWSCSVSSPLGRQTEIDHNAADGAWMHISGDVSAGMGRPATHYDGYLGRGAARNSWVYIYVDAGGGRAVFESAASPRSRNQNWITAYPAHGAGSFVLHYLSETRYVIDFPLTLGKRKAFIHQDCRHA